jgi:hypothetical protein
MTNPAMPAASEGDFRVGRVLNQSEAILRRNFLALFVIGAITYLPIPLFDLWFPASEQEDLISVGAASTGQVGLVLALLVFVTIVLSLLSQSIILHVAFQDMRHRPASLVEALKVGLGRFVPLLLLGICIGIVMMLLLLGLGMVVLGLSMAAGMTMLVNGSMVSLLATTILAVVLGLVAAMGILFARWFVAGAACVVDRRWPFSALGRSAQLTKGYRWRIFGLILLLLATGIVVSLVMNLLLGPFGSTILTLLGSLAWSAVWGAFYAIVVAVAYHDLRVAKEGMDIEQIAAVFD